MASFDFFSRLLALQLLMDVLTTISSSGSVSEEDTMQKSTVECGTDIRVFTQAMLLAAVLQLPSVLCGNG